MSFPSHDQAGTTISSSDMNTNFQNILGNLEIWRGHLIPFDASTVASVDGAYDIGSTDYRFRKAYVGAIGDVKTTNASYTMLKTDRVFLYTDTATATLTLPTAVSLTGHEVFVKKTADTSTALTVDANGTETIDATLTVAMSTPNQTLHLVSDGTNWRKLSPAPFKSQVILHTGS